MDEFDDVDGVWKKYSAKDAKKLEEAFTCGDRLVGTVPLGKGYEVDIKLMRQQVAADKDRWRPIMRMTTGQTGGTADSKQRGTKRAATAVSLDDDDDSKAPARTRARCGGGGGGGGGAAAAASGGSSSRSTRSKPRRNASAEEDF